VACKRQIKSKEDLKDLETAIIRYRKECIDEGRDQQYIKHFSSFLGTRRTGFPWQDYLEADFGETVDDLEDL